MSEPLRLEESHLDRIVDLFYEQSKIGQSTEDYYFESPFLRGLVAIGHGC